MNEPRRMDRREAIKWILAASVSVSLLNLRGPSACVGADAATGYGTDPSLLKAYESGALWPLTFTKEQRRAAAALCDVIIPADDKSPAATFSLRFSSRSSAVTSQSKISEMYCTASCRILSTPRTLASCRLRPCMAAASRSRKRAIVACCRIPAAR